MDRKEAYRSIRKHETGIRQSVSISTFFDADDIHSFRTHVKKLRAILHWLGKNKKDLPPSFKEIYRISGEWRDTQVLLKTMEEKGEDHPSFIAWLRDNTARLQQLWDDSYDLAVIRRLQRSLRRQELKRPTTRRLRSFFNNRVGKIESIVDLPAPADDDLHDIRKELKDLYFIFIWGQKNDHVNGEDAMPEKLKDLGEQCGQFNDRRVALTLLSAYIQQEADELPRQAAEAMRDKWEEERLSEKRRLLEALREFVTPFPYPP